MGTLTQREAALNKLDRRIQDFIRSGGKMPEKGLPAYLDQYLYHRSNKAHARMDDILSRHTQLKAYIDAGGEIPEPDKGLVVTPAFVAPLPAPTVSDSPSGGWRDNLGLLVGMAVVVFLFVLLGIGALRLYEVYSPTTSANGESNTSTLNQINEKLDSLSDGQTGLIDRVGNLESNAGGSGDGNEPPQAVDTNDGTQDSTPGDGFDPQPVQCPGEPRVEEGYVGPLTSEMIEALDIRGPSGGQGDLVRVGTECAAWHFGVGDAGLVSVSLPNNVAGYEGLLYQVGISGESHQRIYTGQEGLRLDNVRHVTVRYTPAYPVGEWVHDCNEALVESNNWGSPSVDDPSFDYILATCQGLTPGSSNPEENPGEGSASNDLASLHCDSAQAAADWINQHKTGNGSVKASDLVNPPDGSGGTYSHGWNWPSKQGHPFLRFDLDALGWFRIDSPKGMIESGTTAAVNGATFWCHS